MFKSNSEVKLSNSLVKQMWIRLGDCEMLTTLTLTDGCVGMLFCSLKCVMTTSCEVFNAIC